MTDAGVSAETFNVRIVSLRSFFGVTYGREEMKRYMQFRHKPRKLPAVLSVEEVADLLAAIGQDALVEAGVDQRGEVCLAGAVVFRQEKVEIEHFDARD